MTGLIILFMIALLAASLLAGSVYTLFLARQQSKTDTERSLEMVPLLIHLPPISDDTAVGGRDARDVVDETISKSQILYNIIASTAEKNRASKLFGQRHITFEIIGQQGFVYFYTAVPVQLVDVVKQAIVSAYPSAALEQVSEPNIFNEAGGAAAVVGGEMVLKKPFAFPIGTYQELKRDALQSVLGSLSSLDKEDGVAVQILVRPAPDGWRKAATSIASKKRKGNYDTKTGLEAIGPFAKQVFTALNKPPEEKKDGGGSSDADLSSLDRSVVEAIEDKTRHPGFEVAIRIVASSNVLQRSQALLQNVVASFALFDAPNKNGFKFEAAKDSQQLANEYILRSFHKRHRKTVLNSVELATIFHFPDQSNLPTSQVTRQESKQVDGPRNIPEQGLLLGYNLFRGAKKPIRLDLQDRQRHMYVVGQTGTGKSTYLENLALQDMLNGDGFAFVDPHGDTVEKLLSMVPKERTEDIIYFSPADMEYPMGLNLFEYNHPDQKDFLIQEALNMLYKLYDPQHQGIMGPRYEHLFRMAALTVMADPAGGTFIDIPKLFRDPAYVKQKLAFVKDQNVIEFWQKEMPQSQRSNEFGEVVSWFVSKFGAFLSNEMMRNIIGQTKSAFDLRDVMDNKKILLVNLSKGRTGELNSKLLGMIFVMKFQAAAMSRATIPEKDRVDFSLYVDEFQNFSTDSFATIMSEARKYHLNLIVANQFTTQLTEEIRDAVFGNMGTIVSFRIGQNDVEALGKYFQPTFDGDDLLRVPNYNTIIRTLVGGVPTQPFSMATLPPLGSPNSNLASALKQLSAAKHGRPRGDIEKEIFARMKTIAPPPPAARPAAAPAAGPWGQPAPAPGTQAPLTAAPNPPTAAPKPAAPNGSFLDEWLQKRQQTPYSPPPNPQAHAHPQGVTQPPRAVAPPAPVQPQPQPTTQAAPSSPQQPAAPEKPKPKKSHSEEHHELVIQPPKHDKPSLDLKNISSDQLDQEEIGQIAQQLKQDLKPKGNKPFLKKKKQTMSPVEIKPNQATPAKEPELPTLPKGPKPVQGHQEADDTIVIDEHGNLTYKEPDA
ncbi:type IV secretory system conjugative DNA transfer family protein [Candidatus Saccharibacteria bacterium]|nr:type IV secretory system conjugative DNA transfer family protein [Candidatus Saccharibacteria bacterium]